MVEKLGVDVGGVIIDRPRDAPAPQTGDTLLSDAVPGAIDGLCRLVNWRFGHEVYLVSRCGERVRNETLDWFQKTHFYQLTGIRPDNVHFCRERREKAVICERLSITHFVDDRLEILGYLAEKVGYLYLFRPRPEEIKKFIKFLLRVRCFDSWKELTDELLKKW